MINAEQHAIAGRRFGLARRGKTPRCLWTWRRVTRSQPCPVCRKPQWCSVSEDATACICMRHEAGSIKPTQNGGFLHILHGSDHPLFQGRRIFIQLDAPSRHDLPFMAESFRTAVRDRARTT